MGKEINFSKEIYAVIIECITGKSDVQSKQKLELWLNESEENREIFDQIKDIWQTAALSQNKEQFNPDEAWERVRNRIRALNTTKIEPKVENRWAVQLLKIAAVFVIAFFIGKYSGIFQNPKAGEGLNEISNWNKKGNFIEVRAPKGSKAEIVLFDGTRVNLNANSSLKYSKQYNINNREVYLEGEAYFQVAKNKKIPFIVKTSDVNIRAVGTAFNVKAYPEEKKIETTLVNGIVEIRINKAKIGEDAKLTLKPNQVAEFIKGTENLGISNRTMATASKITEKKEEAPHIIVIQNIDPVVYTSWKDKKWIIEHESLGDLSIQLERRYDVCIKFKCESIKNYKVTGKLNDETLQQVLDAIKLTVPIDYDINHKQVVIAENKKMKENYKNILQE
ncbi:MAG: FecR family protein [Bacteroidota bacterium]|nr:FecR family protein [Bacteroidota bacterium]MDP4225989.1 FecR family protein [Bacteroidota bacterium]MDP4273994.1 FecR family protein [Bacteroidota bacterium]